MGLKVAILSSDIPPEIERAARAGEQLDPQATRLLAPAQALHDALVDAGHEVAPLHLSHLGGYEALSTLRGFHPDVVWPLSCAARPDRTGGIQDVLELMRLPFVGSTAATRRALLDRGTLGRALGRLRERGEEPAAATPGAVELSERAFDILSATDQLSLVEQAIPQGYPLCVEAGLPGVDTSHPVRVNTPEALAHALADTFSRTDASHGARAVVRAWVEGVELVVPVLGDAEDVLVLPAVEVIPEAAAASGAPEPAAGSLVAPVRPASLSPVEADAQAIRSEIERAAVDAYLAVGCRDLGCVRLVWDGAQAVALSVDAAPSLADDAPLALAARAAGIPLADIASELVEIAAERG